MRLHRFYIDVAITSGKEIVLTDVELIHQWMKVFRLHAGAEVIIFDGSGYEFHAKISELHKVKAMLEVVGEGKKLPSASREVYLFVSIIKKDNFEWVVEKATELGVSHIVPILAERSEKKNVNMERLQKISIEASEQSGRGNLPHVYEPLSVGEACNAFMDVEKVVLEFGGQSIETIEEKQSPIGIFIGPEGGWGENDLDVFESYDISHVSIGVNVLRAETASIAVSTLLLL